MLLWLHIFAAVGWMGAAMVFAMIIGPSLASLTPPTRSEFVVKVLPKYVGYVQTFTLATPLIGVALALAISNGSFGVFSPSTRFGGFISAGAGLAVLAMVIVFGVITPAAKKVVKLTEEAMKSQGAPPTELHGAAKKMRVGAGVGLALLVVILVCMVAA